MKPTIGRKLWFRFNGDGNVDASQRPVQLFKDQPMDAAVACVLENGSVNLTVADHRGEQYAFCGVHLRQDGEPVPLGMYCEWPSYQSVPAPKQPEPVLFPVDRKTADAIVRIIQKIEAQIDKHE